MGKHFVGRKRISAALGMLLALAIAGGALAYWTIGGSGTGTAGTGTVSNVIVNQTSSVSGLYPGGPAQTLSGTFTNLVNPGPVKVGTVTAAVHSGWSSQTDGAKPACTASDFTITGSAVVNAEIPHGTGVGAWGGTGTLTIQLDNLATNQDNCKSVTVPLDYTLTAAP